MLVIATFGVGAASAGDQGGGEDADRVTTTSTPRCAPAETVNERYGHEGAATHEQQTAWLDDGDGGGGHTSDADAQFAAATDAVDDLGADFLGGYVDLEDRAYVYVTDPAADVDPDEVAERLAEATERFAFRVEPGCHPREDLEAIHDRITGSGFLDGWEHAGVEVGIDPATGTVAVTIGGTDPDGLADDLEERHGDQVTVTVDDGAVAQAAGSRLNDRQPHYGGARVRQVNRPNCSAGFAVDLPGGPRIMTTAAHCVTGAGVTMVNGQGSRFGAIRHRSYPSGDVASIHEPLNQDRVYHRFVWTGHESNRIISSKRSQPFASMAVCLSGATTVNLNCGRTVARNVTGCWPDGNCTPGLYRVERDDGGIIVRGGDSGGPAIGRTAPGEANARGQVVGGQSCLQNPRRCPTALLAPIQLLEDQLQVRVATQPGSEW